MTAGIVVIFVGYTASSYGVALLRGYDIPLKNWIDPLHPYQWPAGSVPTIPPGQVFPGGEAAQAPTQNPSPSVKQRIENALPTALKNAFEGMFTGIFG